MIDQSERTLWLLIDELGGRLTEGFDSTAIGARTPMFGSYGPFLNSTDFPQPSKSVGTGLAALSSPISGRVWYRNHHPEPDSLTLLPVKDADILAVCLDANDRPTPTQPRTRTDATGYFSVQCGTFHSGARIYWSFINSYADVRGAQGASPGGNYRIPVGGYRDLLSINDYAARVYLRLSEYIPIGNTRFGRSRGQIRVWASNVQTDTITNYNLTNDRIDYGSKRVFGPDGEFVIMHEYGHAFHYHAIDTFTQACPPSGHPIDLQTNFICAFVEAFADVYSVWLAGARMPQSFYSGTTIENNTFRSIGDGAQIQGAVGGFLLDLLDDVNDPDFIAGDDDGLTYPASYVGDVIRTCAFTAPSRQTVEAINQFIYCAERDLTANTGTPFGNWQTFGSFVEQAAEPSSSDPRYNWNPTSIRAMWRYNLFNLGSLP